MNNITPKQAVEKLIEGNHRFISGVRSVEPLLSHLKMAELAKNGQKPFAIVLTCSDSRSPVETIFDQGIGALFVVRVAGNVVAPSLLASIEFAATNFQCPIVVVLGHTQCGAVNATIQHTNNPMIALPSPHLEELVARIRPAVEGTPKVSAESGDFLQRATKKNIWRSRDLIIQQSKIIDTLVKEGKLSVESAILDISTGSVTFLNN